MPTTTVEPPTNRASWYAIKNLAETEGEVELRIYEDIGTFGVSAKQFADDLERIDAATLHVRLNTNGGDAFDGIAIYNALRAHPASRHPRGRARGVGWQHHRDGR
jgi:ATP-dependent protease ClpP protease subunit